MTKKQLREAAQEHAKKQLGEEQYRKNRMAAKAIAEDFIAGVEYGRNLVKPAFNQLHARLVKIGKSYQSTDKLRRNSEKDYGLSYEEALEMAYENIQSEAISVTAQVKPL